MSLATCIETMRGNLPGGSWTYSAWRPRDLARFVDHLWAYAGPTSHRFKRVLPNGRIELLLNFAEPYRMLDCPGVERCRIAWVGGMQARPLIVEQPLRQDVMGVRLRPPGARVVLGRPLREIAALSVDLADLIGAEAGVLAERCYAAQSVAARFQIVAEWIAARIAGAPGMEEAVTWALARLDASGGTAPIGDLRAHLGLSKARFASLFRNQIGLTPKLYARVVRFHQTLTLLQEQGEGRLIDVALDSSFYDQPHMNAEFRSLGGLTPRAFLAARHPVGDGSTTAEGAPLG
jgi:AraC-like DNA-binding protein